MARTGSGRPYSQLTTLRAGPSTIVLSNAMPLQAVGRANGRVVACPGAAHDCARLSAFARAIQPTTHKTPTNPLRYLSSLDA